MNKTEDTIQHELDYDEWLESMREYDIIALNKYFTELECDSRIKGSTEQNAAVR